MLAITSICNELLFSKCWKCWILSSCDTYLSPIRIKGYVIIDPVPLVEAFHCRMTRLSEVMASIHASSRICCGFDRWLFVLYFIINFSKILLHFRQQSKCVLILPRHWKHTNIPVPHLTDMMHCCIIALVLRIKYKTNNHL
jgi:hypothetical protein